MYVGELSSIQGAAFAFGAIHTLLPFIYPNAIAESPYPLSLHRAIVFGMGLGTMVALLYPNKLLSGALAVSYVGSAYMELTGKIRWNLADDQTLRLLLAAGDIATAAILLS